MGKHLPSGEHGEENFFSFLPHQTGAQPEYREPL
jgi:hypothetical protein